jgi:hypothetical protein
VIDRHQAEVRHVLALRAKDRQSAIDYLTRVKAKRGIEAARKLEADAISQWSLGSRGEWGIWLEKTFLGEAVT